MIAFNKRIVVSGKTIYLRAATKYDAAFVVEMRQHSLKSRYLNKIQGGIEEQELWLEEAYADPYQFYFVVSSNAHERLGLVRIYDQIGKSFSWGSWLIKEGAPPSTAIESALLVYKFALEQGFVQSHFGVRLGNDRVIKFHQSFGAVETGRTDTDVQFNIELTAICRSMQKFRRYLPSETQGDGPSEPLPG